MSGLTALIPAAIHVDDMVRAYSKSLLHIAVVSDDYRTRGTYRRLEVLKPPRRPGGKPGSPEPLRHGVPSATRGRGGIIRCLDGSDGDWSTLFLRSAGELLKVRGVDLAIVELPLPDSDLLDQVRVPLILVAKDPSDRLVARLAREDRLYAWSASDLVNSDPTTLSPRQAKQLRGVHVQIVRVVAERLAVNASLFWDDIGALVRASRGSAAMSELARLAYGLYYDLVGLAIPTAEFERHAGSFQARLDALDRAVRLASGEARDVYLPMVECELRDIAREVGPQSPKASALLLRLREHMAQGHDVLVLARTAPLALAYQSFLSDRGLGGARVSSLGEMCDVRPADVAVLMSPAPTWARCVYGSGIADVLEILAYDTEEGAGRRSVPTEAEIGRRAMESALLMRSWLSRPAQKVRAWNRISGASVEVPPDPHVDHLPQVDLVAPPDESPADIPRGLWDGSGWLVPLEPGPSGTSVGSDVDGLAADIDIDAVLVRFQGGREALLALGGHVTLFRAGRSEPGYSVARLKVGDEVVFIDADSRKDQLAKVLEVADQVPELAVASAWVSYWRSVLTKARQRYWSNEVFADALREFGCHLQTQSIRLWIVGDTIGPDDPLDVRRVGQVAEDDVLTDHFGEVHRSMASLRRAHQRLGQRIGNLARRVGGAAASGLVDRDEIIDERSGLTAADFEDSIDIVTIAVIEPAGLVPFVITGRLTEATEVRP